MRAIKVTYRALMAAEHNGRYCGDQMCCWGPAGKKAPKRRTTKTHRRPPCAPSK